MAACKKAQQTRTPSGDNINVGDVDGDGVRVVDILICDTLPDWPTGTGRFVVGETASTGGSGVDKPVKKVTIYNRKAPAPGANGKPGGGGTDVIITTIDDLRTSTTESCVEPPAANANAKIARRLVRSSQGIPTIKVALPPRAESEVDDRINQSAVTNAFNQLFGNTVLPGISFVRAKNTYIEISFANAGDVCKAAPACVFLRYNSETHKLTKATLILNTASAELNRVLGLITDPIDTTQARGEKLFTNIINRGIGLAFNLDYINRATDTGQLMDAHSLVPIAGPSKCEQAAAKRVLP